MVKKNSTVLRGQVLVELLIALALTAIMLPALITGLVSSRQGKVQQRERLQATALAREAREAVRQVRESGWANIAVNGTYHPVASGSAWLLAPGAETIDGQIRSIVISDAYRNPSGALVETGGSVDLSTKLVRVMVSWDSLIPSSVTSTLYLSRFTNRIWTQTTQADFDTGIKTDVLTTNTYGGEVTLGAGGKADWCEPSLSIAALDLPKNGVANAISAIEGKVFAGTGENASGVSYATVSLANTNPPVATLSGTYNGYKTNGIFGESGYAYLATDNNAKEIEIINLSTTPYTEAGYFNASGNGNGNSIYVVGNVGYMTSGNSFVTIDLSSKTGSRPQVGSTTLAGTGVKMFVLGNYAYVVINSTATQLQIVDISIPASPIVVGQAQLTAAEGVDVYINQTGTRAYLATAGSVALPEFFILDITTKTGNHNTPIGSYDTNGMLPKGVTVVPGNKAIIVGTGGIQQYQAIEIVNETSPTHCTSGGRSGGISIPTGVNGIASLLEADGDAYSYIITGDSTTELKIIEGGPGGKYATSGTFVSSILDASVSASFNRFEANAIIPSGTTLQYQVAGADPVSGSCSGASYIFVGPDGTSATKFSTGSAVPVASGPGYKNPSQCFRYKVFLVSSDGLANPLFTDMSINYSP